MLLNYHSGHLVLSSLCVGALVWLVLSSARVAGFSLQHGQLQLVEYVKFLSRNFCGRTANNRENP